MITIEDIQNKKVRGEKIAMLTAYDYPTAQLIDAAGIDIVLVGDSLANVVLGLESTADVGMTEMLHHAKAVARAVKNALVVGDMPFESYQVDPRKAAANARLFIDEAGCGAVKLEWFDRCPEVVKAIVADGIPVMGHAGLTPQTAAQSGGMTVRGKDAGSAQSIIDNALMLEQVGCFSIVLECIPKEVAEEITRRVKIPTLGIGAGVHCDGQVLVTHDVLGLFSRYQPKFTKKYADLGPLMFEAFKQYKSDVQTSAFPTESHSFHMSPDQLKKLKG